MDATNKSKVLVGILLAVSILICYSMVNQLEESKLFLRSFLGVEKEASTELKVFTDTNLTYYYEWNNRRGLPFHPKKMALSAIGFPLTNYVRLSDSILEDFVFVTAANTHYAKPAVENIANIQEYFPRKKIIFYDIGLNPAEIAEVCFIRRLIYCEVRLGFKL